MRRQIFIVTAQIVDATGAFNALSGYPKTFDSKNYNNDIDKTLRRASGEAAEVYGAMCKRDDRQLQAVTLTSADGTLIERKCIGEIAEVTV